MKKLMMLCVGLVLAGWTAQAAIIAEWDFVPGNFLVDSVGGHTLVQGGPGTVTSDVSSGNSAYFGGTGWLKTEAPLDLTSYRHILVSWSMKDQSDGTFGAVFGHGWDAEGGLYADVSEGSAGVGMAGIRAGNSGYQVMSYPHAYGTGNNVWADFAFEVNLDGATPADQVKVFKNGVSVGTYVANSGIPAGSFLKTTFALGALDGGGGKFVGNIANVTIESIPEPGMGLLLVIGGLFCYARRKRT